MCIYAVDQTIILAVWLSCLVTTDASAPPMFNYSHSCRFSHGVCSSTAVPTKGLINSQFLMLVWISSFWHLYAGVLYTIPGTFRISHSRSIPSRISRTRSIQGRISHSIPGRISCTSISLINEHLFYFVPLTVPHPHVCLLGCAHCVMRIPLIVKSGTCLYHKCLVMWD